MDIAKSILIAVVCSGFVLLTLWQAAVLILEYRFYRTNGWDFSQDSGFDRIDERFHFYPMSITNWQRLFVFRPLYLGMLVFVLTGMLFMTFS